MRIKRSNIKFGSKRIQKNYGFEGLNDLFKMPLLLSLALEDRQILENMFSSLRLLAAMYSILGLV